MKTKYPRTPHLPWSPGRTSDDTVIADLSAFNNVVVTEKMDGENTTIYGDGTCHARSLDSGNHPSRTYVKALADRWRGCLQPGWRVCGENLYAKHSIHYDNLTDYFQIFFVWTAAGECLAYDDMCNMLRTLPDFELGTVIPPLYRGKFDRDEIQKIFNAYSKDTNCEGYVVRNAGEFQFEDFVLNVAKYVRANHVQTDNHWMYQKMIRNGKRVR